MPATRTGNRAPFWVAGVDGCPMGWVAVLTKWASGCEDRGERPAPLAMSWVMCASFEHLMALLFQKECALTLVDIPIGLGEDAPRPCEALARKALPGKASSVFSPPLRPVLACKTYEEAKKVSRSVSGKALSIQAWHITPKIRDVGQWITPARQQVVKEAHPELVFARLNGSPVLQKKAGSEGRQMRLNLLRQHGLEEIGPFIDKLASETKRKDLRIDDMVDAAALSLAAHDHACGRARVFSSPEKDATGLEMAIIG